MCGKEEIIKRDGMNDIYIESFEVNQLTKECKVVFIQFYSRYRILRMSGDVAITLEKNTIANIHGTFMGEFYELDINNIDNNLFKRIIDYVMKKLDI